MPMLCGYCCCYTFLLFLILILILISPLCSRQFSYSPTQTHTYTPEFQAQARISTLATLPQHSRLALVSIASVFVFGNSLLRSMHTI